MGARGASSISRKNSAISSSSSLPIRTVTISGSPVNRPAAEVLVDGNGGELSGSDRAHREIRSGDRVAAGKHAFEIGGQRRGIDRDAAPRKRAVRCRPRLPASTVWPMAAMTQDRLQQ